MDIFTDPKQTEGVDDVRSKRKATSIGRISRVRTQENMNGLLELGEEKDSIRKLLYRMRC